jgi:hypothetical protein
VVRLLLLLLLSCVKSRFLGQGVFVSDGEHCFWYLGVFHDELTDQGRVPESFLEEQNNRFVIDVRDDISLVVKLLDELPEGLSLLLDDVG